MNIKEYKFTESGLDIYFDTYFKHIKLQKLEKIDNNEKFSKLEYDYIEFTFSKEKNNIKIHTLDNSQFVIISIIQIDKKDIDFLSYIFNKCIENNEENKEDHDNNSSILKSDVLLSIGLEKIFGKHTEPSKTVSKKQIGCEIKNENIFAEIKRRR